VFLGGRDKEAVGGRVSRRAQPGGARAYAHPADVAPAELDELGIRTSSDSFYRLVRFAVATFTLEGDEGALDLYWLKQYGGELFVPFGDRTNGARPTAPGATCSTRSRMPTSA